MYESHHLEICQYIYGRCQLLTQKSLSNPLQAMINVACRMPTVAYQVVLDVPEMFAVGMSQVLVVWD